MLKRQFLLTAEMILSDVPLPDKILERDKIVRTLFTMNEPNNYRSDDPDNCVIVLETTFGALTSMIESNGTMVSDKTDCFSFYAKIEYLNKTLGKPKS